MSTTGLSVWPTTFGCILVVSAGSVKKNSDPTPSLLSTRSFPPFCSTNSSQSMSPKPVLFSPSVPLEPLEPEASNKPLICICDMPTPVSLTTTSISFSCRRDESKVIIPPLLVNFMALESKLRITVFIILMSPITHCSLWILFTSLIPFWYAFSFITSIFCITTADRSKLWGLILPFCFWISDHSSRFSSKS